MKNFVALCALLFASMISAQGTATLTGTITDPDAFNWAGASWSANIVNPSGGALINKFTGAPVPNHVDGVLDSDGAFQNDVITRSDAIVPPGTFWTFTFCPLASAACQTMPNITINVDTLDAGTQFSPTITALRFPDPNVVNGYGTVEAVAPIIGAFFYVNIGGPCQQWDGTTWNACGSITPPVSPCDAGVYADWTGASGLGCGTIDIDQSTAASLNVVAPAAHDLKLSVPSGRNVTLVGEPGSGTAGTVNADTSGHLSVVAIPPPIPPYAVDICAPPSPLIAPTCDGTTDDHVAVQAILDAGFPAVFIPSSPTGTEINTGTTGIAINQEGLTVYGNGQYLAYSGTGDAIHINSSTIFFNNFMNVRDLVIDFAGATGTPTGIHIESSYQVQISNIADWNIPIDSTSIKIDGESSQIEIFNCEQDGFLDITGGSGSVYDSSFIKGVKQDGGTWSFINNSRSDNTFNLGATKTTTTYVTNLTTLAVTFGANVNISGSFTNTFASTTVSGTPTNGTIVFPDRTLLYSPQSVEVFTPTLDFFSNGSSVCTFASGCDTTQRTAGTNGFYKIDADGTIHEWITTGALLDNLPTTVTLPFPIPTTIMSMTCSDNSHFDIAGNPRSIGATFEGLSAPYSTFKVTSGGSGASATCYVAGF